VELSEVDDHLPAGHPRVSPEARRTQLAARRRAVLARYQ
jgi:hypothetical protein